MALLIIIETATGTCSVAIGKDGLMIAKKEIQKEKSHAEVITVFIDEVIKKVDLTFKDIDGVSVSSGPGSYTGLRIGVSTAKGLCFALDKPLISIPTLKGMANGMANHIRNRLFNEIINEDKLENLLLCPMIDARRMEVYSSFFDMNLNVIKDVSADIINEDSYAEFLKEHKLIFFGDGAEKCKSALSHHPNAIFIDDLYPSAENMVALAEEKFKAQEFEDLAYFEPFYLKNFVVTQAKNQLV